MFSNVSHRLGIDVLSAGVTDIEKRGYARDLVFTAEDFARVCQLIRARAGIALAKHKSEMVYSRLSRRLRALGQTRFADYLAVFASDASHPEWEHFTNALTTNLTGFFREPYHFPMLADHVGRRDVPPPTIWSCAASTGEEAYSIAMTLAETLGERARAARVLATDIDTRALAVARAGIYPLQTVAALSEERRRRFFMKGSGSRHGLVRIKPGLRDTLEFKILNLLAPSWEVDMRFDAIFCRNMLIYMEKETQKTLLLRLAERLKPDGLLFVGHSENFRHMNDAFRLRSHTVYELADRRRPLSSAAVDAGSARGCRP